MHDPRKAAANHDDRRARLLEALELLNEASVLHDCNHFEARDLERRAREILERLLDESAPNGGDSHFAPAPDVEVTNLLIRSHAAARARRFDGGAK